MIEAAWRAGARLDSWDEHFDYALWTRAMQQCGVNLDEYIFKEIPQGPLPWGHIRCYRGEKFLREEYEKMGSN